jgi:hypothetical protein
MYFITWLFHWFNTVFLITDISKSWLIRWGLACNLFKAESAFPCILELLMLLTSLAKMVWFLFAWCTEYWRATVASDSILTHMYSSLLRELLSVLILLIIINSTLLKFHNVTTLALDNIASLVKNTLFYYLVKFLSLLLGQVLFNFIFRNSLSAVLIRTRGTLTLGIMFIYMIN